VRAGDGESREVLGLQAGKGGMDRPVGGREAV
jgi:hypothetical protein